MAPPFLPNRINRIGRLHSASSGSIAPRSFNPDLSNDIVLKSADPGQSFHSRPYDPNTRNSIGTLKSSSSNGLGGRGWPGNPKPGRVETIQSLKSDITSTQCDPALKALAKLKNMTLTETTRLRYSSIYSGDDQKELSQLDALQLLEKAMDHRHPQVRLQALQQAIAIPRISTFSYDTSITSHNLCLKNIIKKGLGDKDSDPDIIQRAFDNHGLENDALRPYVSKLLNLSKPKVTETLLDKHPEALSNLNDSDQQLIINQACANPKLVLKALKNKQHWLKDSKEADFCKAVLAKHSEPELRSEILLSIYGKEKPGSYDWSRRAKESTLDSKLSKELQIYRLAEEIKTSRFNTSTNIQSLQGEIPSLTLEQRRSMIWWLYGGRPGEEKLVSSTPNYSYYNTNRIRRERELREASIALGAAHLNDDDLETMLFDAAGDKDKDIRNAALEQVKTDSPKIGIPKAKKLFEKAGEQLKKESYKFDRELYSNCPHYAHDLLEKAMKDLDLTTSALHGAMHSNISSSLLEKVWKQIDNLPGPRESTIFDLGGTTPALRLGMQSQIYDFIARRLATDPLYKLAWQHAEKMSQSDLDEVFNRPAAKAKLQKLIDAEPNFLNTLSADIQQRLIEARRLEEQQKAEEAQEEARKLEMHRKVAAGEAIYRTEAKDSIFDLKEMTPPGAAEDEPAQVYVILGKDFKDKKEDIKVERSIWDKMTPEERSKAEAPTKPYSSDGNSASTVTTDTYDKAGFSKACSDLGLNASTVTQKQFDDKISAEMKAARAKGQTAATVTEIRKLRAIKDKAYKYNRWKINYADACSRLQIGIKGAPVTRDSFDAAWERQEKDRETTMADVKRAIFQHHGWSMS